MCVEQREFMQWQLQNQGRHLHAAYRYMPCPGEGGQSLNYAWTEVKQPLTWKPDSAGAGIYQSYKARQAQNHLFLHLDSRDMFLAKDRHWK